MKFSAAYFDGFQGAVKAPGDFLIRELAKQGNFVSDPAAALGIKADQGLNFLLVFGMPALFR